MEVRDASPGYAPQAEMPVVPQGYKQTEVGVIPEDWEISTIGNLASIKTGPFGTLLKASEYSRGDGVPLISVGEIGSGRFRISEHTPLVSEAVIRRLPQYVLKAGDIVFGRKGAVERSALVTEDEDGWFLGSDGISVRPDKKNESRFLAYQFQRHETQQWLLQNAVGTTMASLNQGVLSRTRVVLPPSYDEQRAIATALSDVDALLEALDRLIAKKRDIKQATMQQLLTGQTRLPGFEGEWALFNMAKNSTLKARIGWQGLTTAEYLKLGDYGLVTGTDFNDGKVVWEGCYFVEKNRYEQDKNIQLKPNDVLVTKDGTIGKAAYIDELPFPATLNSGVFVIRPSNDSYHPKYFYYVLMSQVFTDFLNKLAAGSTISHLYQKDFVNFEFPAPTSKEEQIAIATILSDIDTELEALHQRRTKTAALKQAMMQELLTGRTRLVGLQVGAEAGE